MTFELVHQESGRILTVSGQSERSDAPELRKALNSIPKDHTRIVIDLAIQEEPALDVLQVLLVFIRHARSIPSPVEVRYPQKLNPAMSTWGLDHAGWENFFHGR